MACVLTDNFNSYTDGDLPGQGSWINAANGQYFDVQGSVVFEGAKAVYATGVIDAVVTKLGTALADGRQTVYFRSTGRAGWGSGVYQCFRITKGSWGSPNLDVRLNKDGTWQYWNGTSLITGPGTWAEATWNSLEFEWRSSDKKARYRINGGTWTSWDSFTGSASFVNFDYVGLNWWNTAGGTGGLYVDTFQENPIEEETPILSQQSYPLTWTPGKELEANVPSAINYPLALTPDKALDAQLSSEKNYALDWTPGKELAASLSSEKTWPLGWTPESSVEITVPKSSEQNYPIAWTPDKQLAADLSSDKDYPLGWASESSVEVEGAPVPKESLVNWPLGWTSYASKAVIVWKGLTDTLLAAQKKLHRLPYVEAKVYDYEQGIKRLSWTSLYTGSEPDNHHGIAFDAQGSMHRIRSGGSSTLLYQKITNPGPTSDYSQWTLIAEDCYGPCAIAAYGTKVYIFYRTTGNVLWKYYSHDYGQAWQNAQLLAIANVLSMAASWKGTTSTVVCFAATSIKISAIVLDTVTQDTAEHYYNHALDTTYGIGATYQGSEFPIILAAKETDSGTGIVTYALYATKLSAAYNFMALRVLLSAQEDVSTLFQYPDCHFPAVAQSYETLQLTAVESYSGVTAYDRPLLAHLVKDTDWVSAVITEPKFFLPAVASGVGGLRLQSTADYWWMEKPDGVWRAPRPASAPLDLTKDIISLTQRVGAGLVPALINKRSEVVLRLGYKTPAGNETVASLNYWIDSWQYSITQQTQSTLTLFCVDLWGLAFAWSARYSLRWNYTAWQPCRVWEILYQLLGRFGVRLWNNGGVPQSDPMNNYYPKFLSRGGTNAATQLRRLLDFVTDGLVPREALCFAKDLLATETPCYSYSTNPSNPTNSHPILKGEYGENLTITHTQVSGDTEDEPPVHVREAAFDWPLLALGIDNLAMQYDPNLEEPDQAQKRADALLRTQQTQSTPATLIVPTNVGQELYDVVKVTDTRVGLADKNFRVLAIQTDYDRRKALYEQKLTLGAP